MMTDFVTHYKGRLILDPRAAATRSVFRKQTVKDLAAKTMRWGLHLSEEESLALCQLNPDTLGCEDQKLRELYWRKFLESPSSAPYRIQSV